MSVELGNVRWRTNRSRQYVAGFEQLDSRLCLAVGATPPSVSISNASLAEGDTGARQMSFIVSLSARVQQTATVTFQTSDGSAVAGSDYAAATGTITFKPLQQNATITVFITGDTIGEIDETFQVTLSNPVNCTCGSGTVSATGTIRNDDSPVPQVGVAGPAAAVAEGSPARFTFSLSAPTTQLVSVSYATSDLSATAGADYQSAAGTLVFAVGEVSKTVDVVVNTDSVVEATSETFQMRIVSVVGTGVAQGTTVTAVATIKDTTPAPPPGPATGAGGSWTILVYMTGENLNTFARDDINEMEKALTQLPGSVSIVVAWDQPKSNVGTAYSTGGGTQAAWRSYGRSILKADGNTSSIASTFDLSLGEKNTGDPATLVDFVKWGVQQAPAQHYMLQMWGHGGGLTGSQFDSESGSDALTVTEIATALGSAGMPTIDLLSYDNCLMAMAEIGYAIASKVTGVYVASEEVINGTGQNYTTAYNALNVANPAAVTPSQLAAGMVTSYGQQYLNDFYGSDTFSAVTTGFYGRLASGLSQFVTSTASLSAADRTTMLSLAKASIAYEDNSFRDLGGFMTRVSASTGLPVATRAAASTVVSLIQAMVAAKTSDQRASSGVSIYLPTTANDWYLSSYASQASAFCQATGWQTFANWLATGARAAGPTSSGTATRTANVHLGSPFRTPVASHRTYAGRRVAAHESRHSAG